MSNNLGKVCPIVLHLLENTHNLSLFCREKILGNAPVFSVVPCNTHFIRRRFHLAAFILLGKGSLRCSGRMFGVQRKQYRPISLQNKDKLCVFSRTCNTMGHTFPKLFDIERLFPYSGNSLNI